MKAEKLTDEEFKALSECASETEWNNLCDEVKRKRNGCYPLDWFNRVILSGLLSRQQVLFKKN